MLPRVEITKAYIQLLESERLDVEGESLRREFTRRGVPVEPFHKKKALRHRLPVKRDTLVAGDVDSVHAALKALGVDVPTSDSYPAELRGFLGRRIWTSTVGRLEEAFTLSDREPVFVKPAASLKRFSGIVIESTADLHRFAGTSRRTPVYCSEVVSFATEARAFVIRGDVVDVRRYEGDGPNPDLAFVQAVVAAWTATGRAASAYGIDFGVLKDGDTVLLELNDGFALGAYGLADELYAELIVTRWLELVSGAGTN